MDSVTAPDGTRIVYYRSGRGAPLVLVHGTGNAHTRWASVRPALAEHVSVVAVERRGRGQSGDAPDYALAREAEDVAAVVAAVGAPAALLGHSYGALVALEAARLAPDLRRLILYEPALSVTSDPLYPDGFLDELQSLVDAGQREAALIRMYRDLAGVAPEQLEALRSAPSWPPRVAAAHTVVRESRVESAYQLDPARFQALRAPTLLLLGGDSPPPMRAATEAVQRALPNSRIALLPGQQHFAMENAPELFVQMVLDFLAEVTE